MTGLCLRLPLFPYCYRALPSQKELGGLCYRYRTFSAWVQWEHSGSLSQIGFKCMFASRLLNLASFSHWLPQQRFSLLMHLLTREQDHSTVLKILNVSSGGVQSSSENHRCIEAPGVPRHLIMSKHSRMSINPRKVPTVKKNGDNKRKRKKNWKKMAMCKRETLDGKL